jgi:hypothetical protein
MRLRKIWLDNVLLGTRLRAVIRVQAQYQSGRLVSLNEG